MSEIIEKYEISAIEDLTIKVVPAQVELLGFEQGKEKILRIADYLKNVRVTEENLQDAKKLVARVRKAVDSLDSMRKDVRKNILFQYEDMASQIKEIKEITTVAEDAVRDQIRHYDELYKEEKQEKIKEIFTKHLRHYSFENLITFDMFLEPRHLNKSVSMTKIEQEIAQWLDKRNEDIGMIEEFSKAMSRDKQVWLLLEYTHTLDTTETLKAFYLREDEEKKADDYLGDNEEVEYVTFVIPAGDEAQKTEAFMRENGIRYRKITN